MPRMALAGLVAHVDGLGAVHQLDAVQRDVVLGGGLAHQLLIAHADERNAVLLHGCGCAFQHSQRGVVAAHHVNDDLHKQSLSFQMARPLRPLRVQLPQRGSFLISHSGNSGSAYALTERARPFSFYREVLSSHCWKLATARSATAMYRRRLSRGRVSTGSGGRMPIFAPMG